MKDIRHGEQGRPAQSSESASPKAGLSRRGFLGTAGGATVAGLAASAGLLPDRAEAAEISPVNAQKRAQQAREVRFDAARQQAARPVPQHIANGDDERYPEHFANFTKALPHDARGHVVPGAYEALLYAMSTGKHEDFEAIPLGGSRKLVNPQAAFVFDLIGSDNHALTMPPAPALASAEAAGEMVELYWMALTRDVGFADYASNPLILEAADEMSALSDFRGARENGRVTPHSLFRGTTPGDEVGPYVSQFLLRDIPYGSQQVRQLNKVPVAGDNYMVRWDEWLAIQNGFAPGKNIFDATRRYIRNARDLAEYIHIDYSFQSYLGASLILDGLKAPLSPTNPYNKSKTQQGNVTFATSYIAPLVALAANRAQRAVYYQKWAVHRRLRAEEYGGRLHLLRTANADYPLHGDVVNSRAVDRVFSKYGTYLLPMAYPEGSPIHPSYGAGHSVIAGACVTILKAFYDENFVLTGNVVSSADGLSLVPYNGATLTVGGELNKLASNASTGRNMGGVHYRTEAIESMRLGEAVAVEMLRDEKLTFNEDFRGFSFTGFDGQRITI